MTVKPKCWDKQLAYGEALRAEARAYREVDKAQAEVNRIDKEVAVLHERQSTSGRACESCLRFWDEWPIQQDKMCGPVCKKADRQNAEWFEKAKELVKAERNLKQKKRERKKATKKKNEAYKAWKKCLRESQ